MEKTIMNWSDIHEDILIEIMKKVDFDDAVRSEAVCRNWKSVQCRKYARKPRVPIWVRFMDLPLELYSNIGFGKVASLVGKPLYADRVTQRRERLHFARIRVEVDPAKPLPTTVYVWYAFMDKMFGIEVRYERVPLHCLRCKVFGHNCDEPVTRSVAGTSYAGRNRGVEEAGTSCNRYLAPRRAFVETSTGEFEPSFRIFVGNLPWRYDDDLLAHVFSDHGNVVSARVVYDRETGRSRGFGFVTMSSQEEFDDAIDGLDGQLLDDRIIRVNVAVEKRRRAF